VPRARRRFRALVAAHGWRAAAQRHYSVTSARLISAAAAPWRREGPSALGAPVPTPTPHEWRALYKLLTFVPWSTVSPDLSDVVERLRGCAPQRLAARRDA
jgi:hypothetical protein